VETLEAKYVDGFSFNIIYFKSVGIIGGEFSNILSGSISCFRFPNLQFDYRDPEAGFNRSKVSFTVQ